MHQPAPRRSPVLAIAMLATASAFLGGAMVTAKIAVDGVPPMTVAATRFAIATLVLLAIRQLVPRLRGTTNPPRLGDLPIIAGLGMTAAAGYNILLLSGVRLAPASDAAMIGPAVAPIVSTALAAVLLRERPRAAAIAGLVVSIAGVLLVMSPSGSVDGSRLAGDLIFVAAGALFGSYLVLSRFAARRFSPLDITLYGSMFGAVVLLPFAILEGGPARLLTAEPSSLLAIGHLAVLATVAAFVLLNEGLRRLGVARSAGFTMMIPVFGVLQAMLLLGEPLAGTAMIGAVVVLGGIWLSQGGTVPSWRMRRMPPATVPGASPA
ncbi:MAG: DMT family transporter [Chloroflexota bacterium]|nr:DMT family transporter [Chloroflexota bacterium]